MGKISGGGCLVVSILFLAGAAATVLDLSFSFPCVRVRFFLTACLNGLQFGRGVVAFRVLVLYSHQNDLMTARIVIIA